MRLRRSPAEIRFRLRQELWNFAAFLRPPSPKKLLETFEVLFPRPSELRPFLESVPEYRARVLALARQLIDKRMPLLGTEIPLPADPAGWRCDPINNKSTGLDYFRRIPYLDAARAGDHKVIWEMSRHQHLILLAQAGVLDPGETRWIELLVQQLESWWQANPFHCGMNWTSALEVAFRALSWFWVLQIAGDRLPPEIRRRLLASLYQHGAHLAHNLSVYFAPNTHLMGEAVCLHALGCLLPQLQEAGKWRDLGAEWVARSMNDQVLSDGAHFEQSSYYHLYSVEFFLLHALLNPDVDGRYRQQLRRMCEVLAALTDSDGSFPLLGDEDGGRLFHPFGARRLFPRAALTTASFFFDVPAWRFAPADYAETGLWWMGARDFAPQAAKSRARGVFSDCGIVTGGDEQTQIVFTARAFGNGTAGHSHAHALHFILRRNQRDLLLDSGTFTYVGDQVARNRFRSNSAHNTIRIDSLDQASPAGPFRWGPDRWAGRIVSARSEPGLVFVEACLESPGGQFRLTRKLSWSTGAPLRCEDLVTAAGGDDREHLVEMFWQLPPDARWDPASRTAAWPCGAILEPAAGDATVVPGEVSEALYSRSAAQTLRIAITSRLPAEFATTIRFP